MNMDGTVVAVTSTQFEAFIAENKLVIIDFWASWCVPCKQFALTYERVAKKYPTIIFAKINMEEEGELAELFNIRSIPHLMVFKEGIAIYSEAGSMPESTLQELVDQAISVDVSEIKASLDEAS